MLYTLNLHSAVCQLNLKKTERGKKAVYNISSWESLEYVFWGSTMVRKIKTKSKTPVWWASEGS